MGNIKSKQYVVTERHQGLIKKMIAVFTVLFIISGMFISRIESKADENRPIKGARLVAYGDSNTVIGSAAKMGDSATWRWLDVVQRDTGCITINGGNSGWNTSQSLYNAGTYGGFTGMVTNNTPDIVLVMFATNDARVQPDGVVVVSLTQWEQNLRDIVNKIREYNAIPILMTSGLVNEAVFHGKSYWGAKSLYGGRGYNDWLQDYYNITRSVAADMNCGLIDNAADFAADIQNINTYLSDEVHFNEKGSKIVSDNVTDYLNSHFPGDALPVTAYDPSVAPVSFDHDSVTPVRLYNWEAECIGSDGSEISYITGNTTTWNGSFTAVGEGYAPSSGKSLRIVYDKSTMSNYTVEMNIFNGRLNRALGVRTWIQATRPMNVKFSFKTPNGIYQSQSKSITEPGWVNVYFNDQFYKTNWAAGVISDLQQTSQLVIAITNDITSVLNDTINIDDVEMFVVPDGITQTTSNGIITSIATSAYTSTSSPTSTTSTTAPTASTTQTTAPSSASASLMLRDFEDSNTRNTQNGIASINSDPANLINGVKSLQLQTAGNTSDKNTWPTVTAKVSQGTIPQYQSIRFWIKSTVSATVCIDLYQNIYTYKLWSKSVNVPTGGGWVDIPIGATGFPDFTAQSWDLQGRLRDSTDILIKVNTGANAAMIYVDDFMLYQPDVTTSSTSMSATTTSTSSSIISTSTTTVISSTTGTTLLNPYITANEYLWGINQHNNTITGFLSRFGNQSSFDITVYKNDVPITTGTIGSGCVVKISKEGSIYAQYTAILFGDVDGDGTIGAADLLKIKKHLLGMRMLTGYFYVAANANRESDSEVNALDLLCVKKQLLKIVDINQY